MALYEYRCAYCDKVQYVFESEATEKLECGACCLALQQSHNFVKMPPSPMVIHCVDTWMSEPHLDSYETLYELDRQLTIEAAEDKAMKQFNEARKNL